MAGPTAKASIVIGELLELAGRKQRRLHQDHINAAMVEHKLEPAECLTVLHGLEDGGYDLLLGDFSYNLPNERPDIDIPVTPGGLSRRDEARLGEMMAMAKKTSLNVKNGAVKNDEDARYIIEMGALAREIMILSNMGLVEHEANRYARRQHLNRDDLVQDGLLGLIGAVEKFDHTRGTKLSTFARWYIRGAMDRHAGENASVVDISSETSTDIRKFHSAINELSHDSNQERPTTEQISEKLGWDITKTQFVEMADYYTNELSLDAPAGEDGEDEVIELLPHRPASPIKKVEAKELKQAMEKLLGELPPRERELMKLRYGKNSDSYTLESIGRIFGLSTSQVHRLEKKCLEYFRNSEHKDTLRDLMCYDEQ